MTSTVPVLVLDRSCGDSLHWLEQRLLGSGLRAVRTFDLRQARAAAAGCTCPHHGTATCDCQMIVLLVYGHAGPPASLVMHGNDGRTWISLVGSPTLPLDGGFGETLRKALAGDPNEAGL
jgi:hypothetical protein